MDKKIVAGIIAIALTVGGVLWKYDLKGAVCGTATEVAAESK